MRSRGIRRWREWMGLAILLGAAVTVLTPGPLPSQERPPAAKPPVPAETAPKPDRPVAAPTSKEQPAGEKPAADGAATGKPVADDDYELLRLFVDTMDQIQRNYVKDVSRRELMEAAIRGMTSKLDQYSNFIPPEEVEGFKGTVESEFGGIGLQVGFDRGRITVISPIPDTPAARAGIQAGDWITAVEGQTTRDMSLDDAVKRMKGKSGTEVKLTVTRARDGKSETHTLTREVVRVDTVLGERRKADGTWDYLLDADRKIGLVRITSFSRRTSQELKKVLQQLAGQELRGLVLDLRFNPGGLLTSAVEVSDLFVSEGRIVSTAGRNVEEQVVYAKKEGTYEGFPMVVLVNRFSASASEIVAACLQDHNRAVIVGERTWGKGSVQNIIELERGKSALKLTTAGYQRPNGKNINRFEGASEEDDWGVRPNEGYEVKFSNDELGRLIDDRRQRDVVKKPDEVGPAPEKFVDTQLQKGLEYLHQKLDGDKKPGESPR